MLLTYKPCIEDYVKVTMHLYWKSRLNRFLRIAAWIVAIAGLASLLGSILGSGYRIESIRMYIIWGLISFLILVAHPAFVRHKARIYFKSENAYTEEMCIDLTEEFFKISNRYFLSEVNWPARVKVDFSSDWIFFWTGKSAPFYIPKRILTSEQKVELKGILARNKLL